MGAHDRFKTRTHKTPSMTTQQKGGGTTDIESLISSMGLQNIILRASNGSQITGLRPLDWSVQE